jgi:hypothetical protein
MQQPTKPVSSHTYFLGLNAVSAILNPRCLTNLSHSALRPLLLRHNAHPEICTASSASSSPSGSAGRSARACAKSLMYRSSAASFTCAGIISITRRSSFAEVLAVSALRKLVHVIYPTITGEVFAIRTRRAARVTPSTQGLLPTRRWTGPRVALQAKG